MAREPGTRAAPSGSPTIQRDRHFGGIENADQSLISIKLVAFLRVAHGVIAIHVLVGHHAGQRRADLHLVDVALSALQSHLLTVALQFEDAESGAVGLIVKGIGPLQALHVLGGNLSVDFVFQAVDGAEERSLLHLDARLGEVGLGLLEVGRALLGVGAVLGALLVHLVAEIVELGLRHRARYRVVGWRRIRRSSRLPSRATRWE